MQGRFISVDPLLSSGRPEMPQAWNRYSYTLNNPLRYIDPTGLFTIATKNPDERKQIIAAYEKLNEALGQLKPGTRAYKNLERSIERLGKPGVANGVVVTVGATQDSKAGAETSVSNINKGVVTITFNKKEFGNLPLDEKAMDLGHEGVHADDAFVLFAKVKSIAAFNKIYKSNDYRYQSEYDAYSVNAGFAQAVTPNAAFGYGFYKPPTPPGMNPYLGGNVDLWNPSWQGLDQKQIESKQGAAIMTLIEASPSSSIHGYGLKRPKNFQP